MLDLLLNRCIYSKIETCASERLLQVSGTPLQDLPLLCDTKTAGNSSRKRKAAEDTQVKKISSKRVRLSSAAVKTPNQIAFVRHRMLYGRPILNKSGNAQAGLRPVHVLNRCSDWQDAYQTSQIQQYIFPRPYRLHNAFTSEVDRNQTTQPLKDYTVRSDVPSKLEPTEKARKVPRRLRGRIWEQVQRIQKRHQRCSYAAAFNHYCPKFAPTKARTDISTTDTDSSDNFLIHAVPQSNVSSFVRAIAMNIFADTIRGRDQTAMRDTRRLCKRLDQFVKLRRFESTTLHELKQGLSLPTWTKHPNQSPESKPSLHEFEKQHELFDEMLYFLIDGFVIPLITSHFYVTESNVHKNRLFYFRHDVWQELCKPAISKLCLENFDPIPRLDAKALLDRRYLGYSKVRLLPKASGLRMLMNLKRRGMVTRNGKPSLGRSINSVMTPAYNVLKYEKSRDTERLGASLLSVSDIYLRLRAFKHTLPKGQRLYFAKVDVKSCFDTVPQDQVLAYATSILGDDEYRLDSHVEITSGKRDRLGLKMAAPKSTRRFITNAVPASEFTTFSQRFADDGPVSVRKNGSIIVDKPVSRFLSRSAVKKDLHQHIQANIVKIGSRYFRQRQGLPQGGICSSLLVNFFYAAFEKENLSFVAAHDGSLLLRLIDDFLLITTEQALAQQFLNVMAAGDARYGLSIRPEKSLVNFDSTLENGSAVPWTSGRAAFPYCGTLIDTRTLSVTRDFALKPTVTARDALTVSGTNAGGNFERKMLGAFRLNAMKLFFDTRLNGKREVVGTLRRAFADVRRKMEAYMRDVRRMKGGGDGKGKGKGVEMRVVRRAREGVVQSAWGCLKGREKGGDGEYRFDIRRETVEKIGREVLG